MTDLIVPFGEDIIITSDKTSCFAFVRPLEIAWQRWYKATVVDGMRQLKTALQRIERSPDAIFADGRASAPISHDLGPVKGKRFHLLAIACPDIDPQAVPEGWPGLSYNSNASPKPFKIGTLLVM